MRATTTPSTITLDSLLKHLALIEDDYFSHRLLGKSPGLPWDQIDWDADLQWEWRSAADDTPEDLMSLWEAAVERSRETVAPGDRGGGLD